MLKLVGWLLVVAGLFVCDVCDASKPPSQTTVMQQPVVQVANEILAVIYLTVIWEKQFGEAEMPQLNLDPNACYLAAPVVGLIVGPPIAFGMGSECGLIRLSLFDDSIRKPLSFALARSFQSWGFGDGTAVPVNDPPLLFMSLAGSGQDVISGALTAGDLALSLMQKKMIFGHASYVAWNRLTGRAVGAIYTNGLWSPVQKETTHVTPAIVQQPPKDSWDLFLTDYVSEKLDVLGKALAHNLLWERAARSAVDDTHRFAFIWIAIESAIPEGERDEGSFVRRLSLVAGAPRGADSQIIMADTAMNTIFQTHQNPHLRKWVDAIKEMYSYRCKIVHNGATTAASTAIDPLKLDWYFHLALLLNERLQYLLLEGMAAKVTSLHDFWNPFVARYLYSPDSRWIKSKSFIDSMMITHDWQRSRLPVW